MTCGERAEVYSGGKAEGEDKSSKEKKRRAEQLWSHAQTHTRTHTLGVTE